jgi:hypothetical protein
MHSKKYLQYPLSLSLIFPIKVVRLTEEPYSAARAGVKTPIPAEKVRSWLISNKVLSIAFGGRNPL